MVHSFKAYEHNFPSGGNLPSLLQEHNLPDLYEKVTLGDVSKLKEELLLLLSKAKSRIDDIRDDWNQLEEKDVGATSKKIKLEDAPISHSSAGSKKPSSIFQTAINQPQTIKSEPVSQPSTPSLQLMQNIRPTSSQGLASSSNRELINSPYLSSVALSAKTKSYEMLKNFNKNSASSRKRAKYNGDQLAIPNDYSRVKITAQVPTNTFLSFMENYFRPITDNDVSFLEKADNNPNIFEIGPKGIHYLLKWAADEASNFPELSQVARLKSSITRIMLNDSKSRLDMDKPMALDQIDENELIAPTVRCPPLTERILSALVDQRVVINTKIDSERSAGKDSTTSDDEIDHVPNLEEQLKQELTYIGILDDSSIDWKNTEDDEVAAEIRKLQTMLKSQQKVNHFRKNKLYSAAKDFLAYQEFRSIVEELDKQIEQSYLKRNRSLKSKKRKSMPLRTVPVSANLITLIDRRKRFLDSIGPLFPNDKFVNISYSIYEDSSENAKLSFRST